MKKAILDTFAYVGLILEMITAHEKFKAECKASKMFIIKYFGPTLRIRNTFCRAVLDLSCRAILPE